VVRGESSVNKVYVALAILIVILIMFTFLFSGNQLILAIVESKYLTEGWDDSGDHFYDERLLGLEKQASIKYGLDDDYVYSAFLRVTTIKTLFTMSEEELLEKTKETVIQSAAEKNITLNETSIFKSSRVLDNGHKTTYIIYNGTIILNNYSEQIAILGETWNCALSGTSIICIGFAQVTDNSNNLGYNYTALAKVLGDREGTFVERFSSYDFIKDEGLIFNVKCH